LYKEGRQTSVNTAHNGTDAVHHLNEENRRLKAENNVLQKKLAGKRANRVQSLAMLLFFSLSRISFEKRRVNINR
jgi:hypothetical protein